VALTKVTLKRKGSIQLQQLISISKNKNEHKMENRYREFTTTKKQEQNGCQWTISRSNPWNAEEVSKARRNRKERRREMGTGVTKYA
jgi:hypothetical protein